jgi:Zn-dependent protease
VPNLDQTLLFVGAVQILILLLAISVHEAAHAWTAAVHGDRTAAELGRITLNPLRHLDLVGSLLLPILLVVAGGPVFGWARPTPVDARKLEHPRRDLMRVTAAGPLSNLLLAVVAALILGVAVRVLGPEAREVAYLSLLRDLDGASVLPHFPLMFTLVQLAFLNGFLAVFNLIPIPPLDGGHILLQLLPPDWARRLAAVRPFGFMIVLALAMLNVLSLLVLPIYVALSLIINL